MFSLVHPNGGNFIIVLKKNQIHAAIIQQEAA